MFLSVAWPQIERPAQIWRDLRDLCNDEKVFSTFAIDNHICGRKREHSCYSKEVQYWTQM